MRAVRDAIEIVAEAGCAFAPADFLPGLLVDASCRDDVGMHGTDPAPEVAEPRRIRVGGEDDGARAHDARAASCRRMVCPSSTESTGVFS